MASQELLAEQHRISKLFTQQQLETVASFVVKEVQDTFDKYQLFIPKPANGYESILTPAGLIVYNDAKTKASKGDVKGVMEFYRFRDYVSDLDKTNNIRFHGAPIEATITENGVLKPLWLSNQCITSSLIVFFEDNWCMTSSGSVYILKKHQSETH